MMVFKSFLIYINLCGLHKLVSFIMVRENLYNVFYRNEKYVVIKL